LFIKGEESQAQVYLDKAFNFADNHQDLLAELWFYRLAHCPDYRQQASIGSKPCSFARSILAEKSHPIDFAPFFNNTSNCFI
jgi:hypothetical protein